MSSSNWVGCREGLIFDIGLTRLETVVEAAEEAVEEVALLATRTCDRGGASIRLEASGVGKASRVVADLGQQTCRGQLAQSREAGEDGHLRMLLKNESGCLGEVIGRLGGGLELLEQGQRLTAHSLLHHW